MAQDSSLSFRPGAKGDRMARGAAFSLAAMVIGRLAAIVNSVIIVRTLVLHEYGVYSIILLTVTVAAVVASLGVPPALVRLLSSANMNRPSTSSQLLGAGFVLTLTATVFTVIVGSLSASLIATAVYDEPSMSMLIVLALFGLVLTSVPSPLLSTFQAFEQIKELGTRNIVAGLVSIPVTFALVVMAGLLGAVLATLVNSGLGLLINIALLRRILRNHGLALEIPRHRAPYAELLGLAIPALVGGLLVTPVFWFANTMLAMETSFAELGRYSVGYSLAGYLLFIPSAIGIPLIPIVSRLESQSEIDLRPFLAKTLRVATFLLLPTSIILVVFPEPLLALLYSPARADAGTITRILAPGMFCAGIAGVVGSSISGRGKMWDGLLLNLLWALDFILLTVLLVPRWREIGLAIAFFGAYVAHLLGTLAYLRYSWSVQLNSLGLPLLLAFVSFCAAMLLALLYGPLLTLGGVALIGLVVYAEACFISRREREVFVGQIGRLLTWIRLR